MSRLPLLVAPLLATLLALPGHGEEAAATAAAVAEDVSTAPISDADAADHVGDECVVEMVVRAARALADQDICFLNSRRDRRDEDNFTAVIFKGGLERFRAAGIENPALHFLDRTIRVRGVIAEHKDRPQIVVEDPAQIEIVEEPAAAGGGN